VAGGGRWRREEKIGKREKLGFGMDIRTVIVYMNFKQ
jgi:hypothetical protein